VSNKTRNGPGLGKFINIIIIQNSNKIRDLFNDDLIKLNWLNDFEIVQRKLIKVPKFYSQIRYLLSGSVPILKIAEVIFLFYLYIRIATINHFVKNNYANGVVTSDFFEPFHEKICLIPKSTRIWINFWWNDAYEVNTYLRNIDRVPQDILFFNILPRDGTKILSQLNNFYFIRYSNFSLANVTFIKNNSRKPVNQSVFAGEFRVKSPILEELMMGDEYYSFKDDLFDYAKMLSSNRKEISKINNFVKLMESKVDCARQLAKCKTEIENLAGNFLRINFLNIVLDSEFRTSTLIYTNKHQVAKYFSKNLLTRTQSYNMKYDLANVYSYSKVALDFGSRNILHPLISYERTCQLVKNGFGIVRYSDIVNPIFDGLEQKRLFDSGNDLLVKIHDLFEQDNSDWERDGTSIKINFINLRDRIGGIGLRS
jgi:hypothetical protein